MRGFKQRVCVKAIYPNWVVKSSYCHYGLLSLVSGIRFQDAAVRVFKDKGAYLIFRNRADALVHARASWCGHGCWLSQGRIPNVFGLCKQGHINWKNRQPLSLNIQWYFSDVADNPQHLADGIVRIQNSIFVSYK